MRKIMQPLRDNQLNVWQAVDDALTTLPLETPPPDLTRSIMNALPPRPAPQPQAAPRFQIFSWFDVAISLFLSMMFGLVLLLMAGWFIPPQMIPALDWLLEIITYPTIGIPLLIASLLTMVFLALTARLLLTSHRRFARMI
jgi:hypothetical protein